MTFEHLNGAAAAQLTILLQLAGLGVLLGLVTAVAIQPERERLMTWLGIRVHQSERARLALAGGAAGVATAGVHLIVADVTHAPIIPIAGTALGAGILLGPLPVIAVRRRLKLPMREVAVAAATGGLVGMALTHVALALDMTGAASVGALLGLLWLPLRTPARTVARRLTQSPLRPAPARVGAICLVGGISGALVVGAALTAGLPLPSPWLALGVGAAAALMVAVIWLPASRSLSLPPLEVGEIKVELGKREYTLTTLESKVRDDDDLPPLVCVAGWTTSKLAHWRRFLLALQRLTGRRLIAIVLPELAAGTQKLAKGPKGPQLCELLRAAIAELSRDEKVLGIGWSLGGYVMLKLASEADSPFVGIITVGTLGFKQVSWFLKLAGRRGLAVPVEKVGRYLPGSVRHFFAERWRLRANQALSEEARRTLRAEARDNAEARRFLGVAPVLLNEAAFTDPVDVELLNEFAVPVHAVWGATDNYSLPEIASWLPRRCAHVVATVLDWAGHSPHEEHPELFAEFVAALALFGLRDELADARKAQDRKAATRIRLTGRSHSPVASPLAADAETRTAA
jgi:pimeloyl-ACP methyl ester carboxylesterase